MPQTEEIQFDEKWDFVQKKEKHCDETHPADARCGDNWGNVSLDAWRWTQNTERMWSILATCEQQGKKVMVFLKSSIGAMIQGLPPPLLRGG